MASPIQGLLDSFGQIVSPIQKLAQSLVPIARASDNPLDDPAAITGNPKTGIHGIIDPDLKSQLPQPSYGIPAEQAPWWQPYNGKYVGGATTGLNPGQPLQPAWANMPQSQWNQFVGSSYPEFYPLWNDMQNAKTSGTDPTQGGGSAQDWLWDKLYRQNERSDPNITQMGAGYTTRQPNNNSAMSPLDINNVKGMLGWFQEHPESVPPANLAGWQNTANSSVPGNTTAGTFAHLSDPNFATPINLLTPRVILPNDSQY